MAYVKVKKGSVDAYPYSIGQLRRDYSNTSFPKQVPESLLLSYDIYPVLVSEAPLVDERTQKVEQEVSPSLVGKDWVLGWTVADKTQAEIQEYDDSIANNVRAERNSLLSASDWTQVDDAPVDKTAWAAYRQALRDITDQVGFPHTVEWPTKP